MLARRSRKPTRFHDLERTAGTALARDGVDPKTAQRRMGHSTPRLWLEAYAQNTDEGDQEAADKLGARFFPKLHASAEDAG